VSKCFREHNNLVLGGANLAKPVLHTKLCDMLGIKYPLIQTGMGFVTPPALVAAVSNAGGLGIMGAATWGLEETRKKVREVKELTDKPFGVNFLPYHPQVDEFVKILIDEKVKVASYSRAPSSKIAEMTKPHGIINIASIGLAKHATKTQSWGVDAVIAQGGEGGGHTGAVGTIILLPECVDSVKIPVIAAGGFCDGRGLVAALALGCAGMAMGTRFLITKESPLPDHIKKIYMSTPTSGTIVTDRVDGLPQRMLKSKAVDKLESQGRGFPLIRGIRGFFEMKKLFPELTTGQLIQTALGSKNAYESSLAELALQGTFPKLLWRATIEGDADNGVMPSGQVTGRIHDVPSCKELIERIMSEAEDVLNKLC
jgi:NAD(P)H-dependent flavin oxidoreductase YrpB (nitropropane dioxygenase family)